MQIPPDLFQAILRLVENKNIRALKMARNETTHRYKKGIDSKAVFLNEEETLSYLATRLPATYAACFKVFQNIQRALPQTIFRSFLDLGSGPGSATWAALEVFESLSKVHLIEREASIIEIGKELSSVRNWPDAHWEVGSLLDPETKMPHADLAVFSYSYGELDESKAQELILRMMNQKIPVIAVIEPGTPRGYEKILSLRSFVLQNGAQLVAPCPHSQKCPMAGKDWCHFAARVERSKLHKTLKDGALGYEDEKFSYLVFTTSNTLIEKIEGRVVRSPLKGKGHVKFLLCSEDGQLNQKVVTRSDKIAYKAARDLEWGDSWCKAALQAE